LRLRLGEADGLIACRMYHNWPEVRDGFAKNILAGYGGVLPMLASALFHGVVYLLPYWLALTTALDPVPGAPSAWAWLTVCAWAIGLRAITAWTASQRIRDAIWLPVSVVLMTAIAIRALNWRRTGGPVWKGRTASEEA
jgi:hypothetical protein